MLDVAGDWSTEEDLDSCEDGNGEEGEVEGVKHGLNLISLDPYPIEEMGNYKNLGTGCVNGLLRCTRLGFLDRL